MEEREGLSLTPENLVVREQSRKLHLIVDSVSIVLERYHTCESSSGDSSELPLSAIAKSGK